MSHHYEIRVRLDLSGLLDDVLERVNESLRSFGLEDRVGVSGEAVVGRLSTSKPLPAELTLELIEFVRERLNETRLADYHPTVTMVPVPDKEPT